MFQTFSKLASVLLMIGAGALARHLGIVNKQDTARLSRLLTTFFYPALIFSTVVTKFSTVTLAARWTLPAGAFGIMLLGFAVGSLAVRLTPFTGVDRKRAFHLQCTINNYSFLPLPLALFYFGDNGVANLVYSTLGSEAALWTLGVMALTGHKAGMKTLRHLLSIPLLAMAAAVIVILLRDNLFTAPNFAFLKTALVTNATGAVLSSLELFGHATIPIAMLIAGSRMADLNRGLVFTPVQVTVAALRLVIIPAAAILLLLLLPLQPEVRKILLLVAIMPSAISSVMLSEIYNGNAEFAASSVLVTHVGALLTVPVWLALWL